MRGFGFRALLLKGASSLPPGVKSMCMVDEKFGLRGMVSFRPPWGLWRSDSVLLCRSRFSRRFHLVFCSQVTGTNKNIGACYDRVLSIKSSLIMLGIGRAPVVSRSCLQPSLH